MIRQATEPTTPKPPAARTEPMTATPKPQAGPSRVLATTRPEPKTKPKDTQPEESARYRVPGTARTRTFQRQVEKARAAIQAGTIEPKARPVANHCQCANRTALSILSALTDSGTVSRSGRGWVVA